MIVSDPGSVHVNPIVLFTLHAGTSQLSTRTYVSKSQNVNSGINKEAECGSITILNKGGNITFTKYYDKVDYNYTVNVIYLVLTGLRPLGYIRDLLVCHCFLPELMQPLRALLISPSLSSKVNLQTIDSALVSFNATKEAIANAALLFYPKPDASTYPEIVIQTVDMSWDLV